MKIISYRESYRDEVVSMAIDAWEDVFPKTQDDVPSFVYENFWPNGWQIRQANEVGSFLDRNADRTWVATSEDKVIGFVGVSIHPEDQMGEITIIAVHPAHQRKGVGRALLDFGEMHIKKMGMKMVMVETVGDTGHKPARKAYESQGYVAWPVARYFKDLR